MKTLVLQSYRTENVPGWLTSCLDSVRGWTARCGFDYEFVNDELFDYAPDWFRERCKDHFYPITDIARLVLVRERLSGSYERVVWLDADVIIFNPGNFNVDNVQGYAFCHEIVLKVTSERQLVLSGPRINNAVMVFESGHPMLHFYIFAAEEIIRQTPTEKIIRTSIGPEFLGALSRAMPVHILTGIGLFTPRLMQALIAGDDKLISAYRKRFGFNMAGANLCHFFRKRVSEQAKKDLDATVEHVIQLLLDSKGHVLNKWA